MSLPSRRIRLSIAAAVVAMAVALLLMLRGDADQPPPPGFSAVAVPTYRVDTDHETFASSDDIRASAAAIVIGTIQSHSTVPGVSPGVDGAGDPLPALPHTDYVVKVTEVIAGPSVTGETITVSLTGGATPEGNFVLEGGPVLADGASALFFLGSPTDGKYYPLAGGAAVAQAQADGSFLLPADVTGQATLSVTKAELTKTGSAEGGSRSGAAASPDTRAPRTSLAGSRRKQKLGRAVFVLFSCPDEACAIEARAKLRLPKVGKHAARTYKLKRVELRLAAKGKGRVVFPLSPSLRAGVRRVLNSHRTVAVEVTLEASDAAQNRATREYRIVLIP